MDRSTCDCGTLIFRASDDLGCIECGRPCCPVCAYVLESVAYCASCATHLLEAEGTPVRVAVDAVSEPRGVRTANGRTGGVPAWSFTSP